MAEWSIVMKILVVNAGSSSLKYQLIDMENEQVLAKGNCERIGSMALLTHKTGDKKVEIEKEMPTHSEALDAVMKALTSGEGKVIDSLSEITAVGHRVVQGGSEFTASAIINDDIMAAIKRCIPLAPLHNPANILGIEACVEVLGKDVPQVAVFDTAFHALMPSKAYLYAIPYEYYEKYEIRRYGFHGTSHRFVSQKVADLMGKDIKDLKIITCHLGNGASIAAVNGGVSVDTTMGLTPLDGFMMGTRSGSLDPSVVTFIQKNENLSADEMDSILNKKSGVLGVSGVSNDNRDVCAAAENGNERAKLAIEMQNYQIIKYVGAYAAAMNGVDAIVFTGGIGENSYAVREAVCESLTYLGVELDKQFNLENAHIGGKDVKISTDSSKVAVFAVSTDEEMVIARDTLELVK